jgi:hypothetical protein
MSKFLAIFALLLAAPTFAQEGHPLKGTWHGSYGSFGSNSKNRTDVTMVLDWDGKQISGLVNPGPDSVKMKQATLDPSQWAVHFEFDMKYKNGSMDHIVVDGKMDDVTLIRRSIIGTWKQGDVVSDFKMTRDI